ncbi:MAG: nitroreductase family protein [Thermoleophilia bacterium]
MATAELPLTGREVLTTTRCVRKRLDLTRPVDRALIEEAVDVALQAPTGSFSQIARFICVDDPEKRRALGDIYRRGWEIYEQVPVYAGRMPLAPGLEPLRDRAMESTSGVPGGAHGRGAGTGGAGPRTSPATPAGASWRRDTPVTRCSRPCCRPPCGGR